ncbi:ATP-binding cassette domain-containing protein [bacterium]|nr:ATP-binding cassette domain-containing protein [bacterium]
MTAPLVIDVEGLTKIYGGRRVVDDVTLKVPKGSIYGFIGPNGSGKTTTIRMVCGLLKPDHGRGTCLGYDVLRQSAQIKARVGYMTQKFSLYADLSIRENLEVIARLYQLDRRKARIDDALEYLGLAAREKQLAGNLSGGWKQRLALAACMIHEPELLLLDEPTAGVDPKARRDFWDQIRRFAKSGVTTLVSTHYMDEAVQCDSIAFISFGRKLIDAPTVDIPEQVGLAVQCVTGPDLAAIGDALEGARGVAFIARFGAELHVCGEAAGDLASAIRSLPPALQARSTPIPAGLEEAFIHLMAGSTDNFE